MPRRLRIIVPLAVVAALLAWVVVRSIRPSRQPDEMVAASGTIEALQVSAASKVPGRIERIHVAEGDTVRTGLPLVTIDGRELRAQIDQARAAIDAARARVAQAEAALVLQQRQVAAQIAQAEAALEGAQSRMRQAAEARALTSSQAALQVRQAEAAQAAATQHVRAARAARDRATQDLRRMEALFRDGAVSAQQLDAARSAASAAQAQYDAAVEMAAQAEAALRLARDNLRQVRLREEEVAAARAQAEQAQASLRLARAGEELIAQRRADLAAARAQLRQAEASLRYLLVQQQNLIVTSPLDGVVVAKLASEGEIVGAGAPILTLADLRKVWVRLYIPLPRLGAIALGQRAEVTTDALPGRTFPGTVTEIAQQAEFTPSNVQTREERIKLVFAVKVTLANPDGLLKPGMPADAVIILR
ncbi:MAG: efflux RND transporter periplasmic adaptor subunit [Armatimonadota bacterium]|nr:efflux RND transporter periplasmic adaptor subunit [Armatimonadota bacterium]MDR7451204.1 efflux RND transporter periplasmic adaptor subunit [Armatimonadota bacterium]MDR7467191.1 efflux RND transporter periplasmic adaptor subunit [Armatimonadota bacterium]MDR7495204.1 efflux RND transporter periplasmic adaptor subunit [Armatimonadota bacterium]MDR7500085.1 efflux RND transporter periplasmic adaptor subunit [Armatimonadota bacterium]